ncbi:MAG: hypothetical protein KAI34_03930, partial [Candidatus Lokiarchaeota archaeon]|nr:hypothetical protein [Candidatus Lokiarchaeota archaeon]
MTSNRKQGKNEEKLAVNSPYGLFNEECITFTQETLQTLLPDMSVTLNHEIPAKLEFGELAIPVFHIAKKVGKKPRE